MHLEQGLSIAAQTMAQFAGGTINGLEVFVRGSSTGVE
jgi:hypothetical protein